jgi:hypothetical protein
MSPWRSRKARLFPEQQVARSSRAGDTVAHDSPVREAVRKTAEIGFDPRVRLHGLWSNGQDSGLLNRQCAFDSRRADQERPRGAHAVDARGKSGSTMA